jgi:hypothetical protein
MRASAVIFVPSTLSLDGAYAQECITYALDRGYQLAAIERDWRRIDRMLQEGRAGVVVVGRERHTACPASEEVTQKVRANGPFTDDRVRRILNAQEPVPDGVAPETVAALRLLWWRLQDRG